MDKFVEALRQRLGRARRESVRLMSEAKTPFNWLLFTLLVLAVFWSFPADLENRVRWAGVSFEIFGLILVIRGIDHARQSFGKPSFTRWPIGWLRSFKYVFIKRPAQVIQVGTAYEVDSAMRAEATVHKRLWNMEDRVAWLQEEVKKLQNNILGLHDRITDEVRELRADLDTERAERERAEKKGTDTLENQMIGDSHLELAGAAFLFIGVIFGNMAKECAEFFGWVGIR